MNGEPYDSALDRARRLIAERRFALGVQLIAAHADPLDLAMGYSNVAEGTIVAMADLASDEFAKTHGRIEGSELMILALGRLGGRALTHASDLDIIYVYDAPEGAMSDGDEAAQRDRLLQSPGQSGDSGGQRPDRRWAALRRRYAPEAAGRRRACSPSRSTAFSTTSATKPGPGSIWRCAGRGRSTVPGQSASGLRELIRSILSAARDPAKTRADAAKMREDMTRHKKPSGPLDIKLGPGGLVDLEFAVHTLQLVHGQGLDPRLEHAIEGLAEHGLIDPSYDPDLRLLSRMLVVMRLVAPEGNEPSEKSRGAGRGAVRARELGLAACGSRRGAAEDRCTLEIGERSDNDQ